MKVRPTSDPHQITVVTGGRTVVHRVDLEPGWTVWYTPGVAAGVNVLDRLWADSTGRPWADATTRQWAA